MSSSLNALILLLLLGLIICEAARPFKKNGKSVKKRPLKYTSGSKTLNFLGGSGVFSQKLHNYYDTYYKGIVTVGNPPQELEVVFDTGCTLSWFPRSKCVSTGPHNETCTEQKQVYEPKNSTTAVTLREFSLYRYYTQFYVKGTVYRDTLRLGNPMGGKQLELKDAMVGAASTVKMFDHGVIALARVDNNFIKPFHSEAYNIAKLYKKPLFTIHLKRCDGECEDGGQVTFGSLDSDNCGSSIKWTPLVDNTYMWQFIIYSINIDIPNLNKLNGIVDSGNSYIRLPSRIFDAYSRLWKINEEMDGKYYSVDCDSKLKLAVKINGNSFEISEKELVLSQKFENGRCVLAMSPHKDNTDIVVLGVPFFRAYCVSHDTEKQQVGFAPIKKLNN